MGFTVEFPGLGWSFDISRVAFTIFGIDVYWYGILIVTGMVLAVAFALSQCKRFGIDADRLIDVVMVGLVCALIGGRLYYLIFNGMSITRFFHFRDGGIAIYGGIIGAFLGGWAACRWRKVAVLPLFDLAGMGFLIGQSLGRWGNFFNQEAFGTNTALPWGMYSQGTRDYLTWQQSSLAAQGIAVDPSLPVHPTFLYESLWCALGFLLLFLYRKHRKFNGEIFLFYVIWYGIGRAVVEGFRTDSLMTLGGTMRVSQLLGILSALAGLVIWIMARVRTKGKPLAVPVVPPRTAKVTLEDGRQVQVSWPANTKVPSKTEKLELAQKQLAKEEAEKLKEAEPAIKGTQAGLKEKIIREKAEKLRDPVGSPEELVREREAIEKAEEADDQKEGK